MKHGISSATAEFKMKSAELRLDIAIKFADYGEHSKSAEQSLEAVFETAGALAAFDEFNSSDNIEIIEYIRKNYVEKRLLNADLMEFLTEAGPAPVPEGAPERSGSDAAEKARDRIRNASRFMEAIQKHIAANYASSGITQL